MFTGDQRLDHVLASIIRKFPQLITIIANIEFIVNKNAQEINGKTYISNKDIDESKLIVEINYNLGANNYKNKTMNDILEHIVLHELMHIVDKHYMLKEIAKNLEYVDQKLLVIAAEYVVARLLQHYVYSYDDLFDYEKYYLQTAELICPELASMQIDQITLINIYEMLQNKQKQLKKLPKHNSLQKLIEEIMQKGNSNQNSNQSDSQQNNNSNQDSTSSNSDNSDANNTNNNSENSSCKRNSCCNNSIDHLMQQNSNNNQDSSNINNNNSNNSDQHQQIQNQNNGKPAGINRGNDNYKTFILPDAKKIIQDTIKLRKLVFDNFNPFTVEKEILDPIADLKSKLLQELRIKNTYDYFVHDYITKPDFEYFIPSITTRVRKDDYILIVDVSGSMADYIEDFIQFVLKLHKYIRKIYVHDYELVQVIDMKQQKLLNNSKIDINISCGGTSFIPAYTTIIQNNETKYKILHVTDLYTNYEDFNLIRNFKQITYFVIKDEYDKDAVKHLESLQLKNYKIVEYELEKIKTA